MSLTLRGKLAASNNQSAYLNPTRFFLQGHSVLQRPKNKKINLLHKDRTSETKNVLSSPMKDKGCLNFKKTPENSLYLSWLMRLFARLLGVQKCPVQHAKPCGTAMFVKRSLSIIGLIGAPCLGDPQDPEAAIQRLLAAL